MRFVLFLLAVCFLSLIFHPTSLAQSVTSDRERREAAWETWVTVENDRDATVPRRIEAINHELSTIGEHVWAGVYESGMPLGDFVTVRIAPKCGVSLTSFGCCGEGPPNCGQLKMDELGIRLHWDFPGRSNSPLPEILIPICWGDSLFLIDQIEILHFCIDARAYSRKVDAKAQCRRLATRYLWRSKDPVLPSGKPEIPKAYQKYEEMPHIVATIASQQQLTRRPVYDHLLGHEFIEQRITIDVGEESHVLPGMHFWSPQKFLYVVTAVRDKDSDAVRVEKAIHKPDFPEEIIGDRVSTESPFDRVAPE